MSCVSSHLPRLNFGAGRIQPVLTCGLTILTAIFLTSKGNFPEPLHVLLVHPCIVIRAPHRRSVLCAVTRHHTVVQIVQIYIALQSTDDLQKIVLRFRIDTLLNQSAFCFVLLT